MHRYLYLYIIILFISVSCRQEVAIEKPSTVISDASNTVYSLENFVNRLNHHSFTGRHDSVIILAKPVINNAIAYRDTLSVIRVGAFLAQSYLFMEDIESVRYYVDLYNSMSDYPMSSNMHIMWDNVLGSYYLRTGLDYSKALNCYIEGLEYAEQAGNNNNIIALLANIVNIFYVQGSSKGIGYAERAYGIAMQDTSTADYAKCAANIVMAQMHFLQHDYDETLIYLRDSEKYAADANAMSQEPFIKSMYAQIYQRKGDMELAERYYEEAVGSIGYTDPGAASQIYLAYGEFLRENRRMGEASDMLYKGLEVSEMSGNIEYRQKLLGEVADMCYEAGSKVKSADYYKGYKLYSDSISGRRETEFYDLILSNIQSENEKRVLTSEIERQEAEKQVVILVAAMVVVILMTALILILYSRQRRMYRELVAKHQEYMSRLDQKEVGGVDEHTGDVDKDLFLKIETLMKTEKIYRSKQLSLESLAERLGTNRTYCSKAINTFANMTFNRYVDRYRIEEAARIISQSEDDILLKGLADDLGYNSVTVFSKAFQREIGCPPSVYKKEVKDYNFRKKSDNS